MESSEIEQFVLTATREELEILLNTLDEETLRNVLLKLKILSSK